MSISVSLTRKIEIDGSSNSTDMLLNGFFRVGSWNRMHIERGGFAVECWTRNRVSPCSNPLCYRFEDWAFSFRPRRPSSLSCVNGYLAIDGDENTSE